MEKLFEENLIETDICVFAMNMAKEECDKTDRKSASLLATLDVGRIIAIIHRFDDVEVLFMQLVKADVKDCDKIWSMQIKAFTDLLEKYQDYETSPGNETKERVEARLLEDFTYFYYIFDGNDLVGAVRVVDKQNGSRKRVSPIFIMKEFRNKGLAQKTFEEIEKIHGTDHWELATILQEVGNCHLYEKLGYKKTGVIENINEKMDIVYYEKN